MDNFYKVFKFMDKFFFKVLIDILLESIWLDLFLVILLELCILDMIIEAHSIDYEVLELCILSWAEVGIQAFVLWLVHIFFFILEFLVEIFKFKELLQKLLVKKLFIEHMIFLEIWHIQLYNKLVFRMSLIMCR